MNKPNGRYLRVLLFFTLIVIGSKTMSESQVNAYFIDDHFVENTFGSKDTNLLQTVLADPSGKIANYSPRFSGLTLAEAATDLVNGVEKDKRPFHYSFALWIIIDALCKERPNQPHIPYPFMDLYDFNDALEAQTSYAQLLTTFEHLNKQGINTFPHQLKTWADIPGFAYLSKSDIKKLLPEIRKLTSDIKNEEGIRNRWTLGIEEPEDVLQILGWINEAAKKDKNLLLVMEGDL